MFEGCNNLDELKEEFNRIMICYSANETNDSFIHSVSSQYLNRLSELGINKDFTFNQGEAWWWIIMLAFLSTHSLI